MPFASCMTSGAGPSGRRRLELSRHSPWLCVSLLPDAEAPIPQSAHGQLSPRACIRTLPPADWCGGFFFVSGAGWFTAFIWPESGLPRLTPERLAVVPAQTPLFVDSIEEALRDAVSALKGPKSVGVMLWPELSADVAAKRLNHCLDPERPEKLELSQVLLIAKKARSANCHTLIAYLCAELDYEWKPIDPETVEARERRELAELLVDVRAKLNRMERRDAERTELRRVA